MSETNHQRFLLTWALGATLIAVGALGYIAGKQAGRSAPVAPAAAAYTATDANASGQPARPRYVIPDAFASVQSQWRSTVRDKADGYAALFDPKRQRLILEHCRHHAYASAEAVDAMTDFCTPLASGRLTALTSTQATLVDRDGQEIRVGLALGGSPEAPTLRMAYAGLTVDLAPGSRNDLMQAMEALPKVRDNKREYLVATMSSGSDGRASERDGNEHINGDNR